MKIWPQKWRRSHRNLWKYPPRNSDKMRQEKIMTANMWGENIANFDHKNIKICPDGWIEFFSHNTMDHAPRFGENIKIWKYAESSQLYVHERGDDSDSKQLKGNYWKLIFWNRQCLRIVNVLVACRWWWFRWKWLHASDGVYIFPVSESSILQSTALLHLFQENI